MVNKLTPQNQDMNALKKNLEKAKKLGRYETVLYSLDVECVDVKPGNKKGAVSKKAPARVALVDSRGEEVFNEYIMPKETNIDYAPEFNGVTKENLRQAKCFGDVRSELLCVLPKSAIIVGMAIENDLNWMKLKKGVDFADSYDISKLFELSSKEDKTTKKFSLRNLVKNLKGLKESGKDIHRQIHDPFVDAGCSMEIFLRFHNSTTEEIVSCQERLLKAGA